MKLFIPFITFILLESVGRTLGNEEAHRLREMILSRQSIGARGGDTWTHVSETDVVGRPIYMGLQDGLRDADKIQRLPGEPMGTEFDQYSGYVTVDPTAGRALFYYFAEAPEPDKKPLVLWLSGGPGVSSLGGGAFLELGPFYVKTDGKTLYKNEYAWNNVANMIFLETPSGVGYSYSNSTSDYNKNGDRRTTDDTYTFLVNWLERFPHYKGRDFFITGQSYAGHFIPNLAAAIIARNKAPNASIINLKGIAIGNGVLERNTNAKGVYNYFYNHAMISHETYRAIEENCSFRDQNYTKSCLVALTLANNEFGWYDTGNIYATKCLNYSESGSKKVGNDSCADVYVQKYLNLPEVQKALHANTTGLKYPWTLYSDFVRLDKWNDAPVTMLPTIKQIIASNISVWLYSGDLDSTIPFTSTQYWIEMLELPVEKAWRSWYSNYEVGGHIVGYKGLVFVTVRGAGIQVPQDQPERSLIMFSSFLQEKFPQ